MNKAIFLDRDGTINVEKNYLFKIEDFELLPGVVEALKKFQQAGFLLIIITNQSGIGRGYYTEADFQNLNSWMIDMLKKQGVFITDVYFCPHLPDAQIEKYRKECNCRKPKLGMYEQAIYDHNISLENSYAIGDKIRDCAICKQTICKGFLVEESEEANVIEDVKSGKYNRVKYAKSLAVAAKEILKQN